MEDGLEGANKTEGGLVYVVHNDWIQNPKAEDGCKTYKIGITAGTVEDRYYGLGLKMPSKFVCDFAYEFDDGRYRKVESGLHDIFDAQCKGGEWFELKQSALNKIRSLCEEIGGKLVTSAVQEEIEEQVDESEEKSKLKYHKKTEEECKEEWDKEENKPIKEIAEYLEDLISKSGAIDDLRVRYENKIFFCTRDKNTSYFRLEKRSGVFQLFIQVNADKLLRLNNFLAEKHYKSEPYGVTDVKGLYIPVKNIKFIDDNKEMFIEIAKFVKDLKTRA